MIDRPRLVVDTNVLVSATIFRKSTPRQALKAALRAGSLVMSRAIAEELTDVLARPKFDRFVSPERRKRFLAALISASTFQDPAETIDACRDPKDNKFLELAVAGNAEYIISGDQDLLVLNPFRGILIITPAEFLEKFSREQPATPNE